MDVIIGLSDAINKMMFSTKMYQKCKTRHDNYRLLGTVHDYPEIEMTRTNTEHDSRSALHCNAKTEYCVMY